MTTPADRLPHDAAPEGRDQRAVRSTCGYCGSPVYWRLWSGEWDHDREAIE